MSNAIYLRITMHDNDFTCSLKHVANVLYKIFQDENRFPEEDEIPLIEKYVKELLFSVHNICSIMRWNKNSVGFTESSESLFTPHLEFIDYLDIPDWDNYESIYIPMFEGEILVR